VPQPVAESDSGELSTFTLGAVTVVIPSGDTGVLIIESGPSHKTSLSNVNTKFRQIMTATPAGVHNLASAYQTVFGIAVAVGQVLDLRVRVIDDTSFLGSTYVLQSCSVDPA